MLVDGGLGVSNGQPNIAQILSTMWLGFGQSAFSVIVDCLAQHEAK
jgi:hypothetical protein